MNFLLLFCVILDVSYEAGMKKIHAVKSSGEVIVGMEVFREVYKVTAQFNFGNLFLPIKNVRFI